VREREGREGVVFTAFFKPSTGERDSVYSRGGGLGDKNAKSEASEWIFTSTRGPRRCGSPSRSMT